MGLASVRGEKVDDQYYKRHQILEEKGNKILGRMQQQNPHRHERAQRCVAERDDSQEMETGDIMDFVMSLWTRPTAAEHVRQQEEDEVCRGRVESWVRAQTNAQST